MSLPRSHRPDYRIVLYVGLLMLLGLIVMYAIGPQRANVLNLNHGTDFYSGTYFVLKQAVSLAMASVAFAALALLPFTLARRYADSILVAGLVACALLLAASMIPPLNTTIAQCSLGACRWFNLGPLGSFQPAELLKFGMLLYVAGFLSRRIEQGRLNDLSATIYPLLFVVGLGALFTVVFQKDMGTGIAMISIVATMLMVGGISRGLGLKLLAGLLIIGALLIVTSPHRVERLGTFLRGDSVQSQQTNDEDYHIKHAKLAIGTGGLFGVGIGNSVQATGYLPEAINDSVFAIMGETFGFVGLVGVICLFGGLLMRVLKVSDHSSDAWMKLVAAGTFGWLGAHIVLNIASMVGIFPLTGITLPLLSFGGTSMVFIAAALGLVFQISKYTTHTSNTKKEVKNAYSRSGRRLGRTRHAGRSRTS